MAKIAQSIIAVTFSKAVKDSDENVNLIDQEKIAELEEVFNSMYADSGFIIEVQKLDA